jgi:tetratricopeptide (TPR) repeat protein
MIRYLFALTTVAAFAQHPSVEVYHDAMRAYEAKRYGEAASDFAEFFNAYEKQDDLFASAKTYHSRALDQLGQRRAAIGGFEYVVDNFRFSNLREPALFDLGKLYFRVGDYERCRRRMTKLIVEYDDSEFYGGALYWIGESYLVEGRTEEAVDFLANAVAYPQNNADIDLAYYALGRAYEGTENYEKAVECYDEILSYHEDSPFYDNAQIRIGVCYFHLDEYEHSILELSNPIVENMPLDRKAEAIYLLANAYYRSAYFEEAAETYADILREYPSAPVTRDVKYALAWSYFQMKRYADAFNVFHSISLGTDSLAVRSFYWKAEAKRYSGNTPAALKIYGDLTQKFPESDYANAALYQMGVIYFNRREYELAADLLKRSLAAKDVSVKARAGVLLGEIAMHRKDYTSAVERFEEARRVENLPEELALRTSLGIGAARYYLGKYDDAIVYLADVDQRAPNFETAKVSFFLAESYFEKKYFEEALVYYKRIPVEHPELGASATYGLGYSLYNLRQYEAAGYRFQDFVKYYPTDDRLPDAEIRLANCYLAERNFSEAATTFEKVMRESADASANDYVQYQYALALFNDDRDDEAARELRKLIRAFPASEYVERARYLIGRIHFKQNNYAAVITHYREVLETSTNRELMPLAYYSMGDSYFNLGDYDSAIVNYDEVLVEFPRSAYAFDAALGVHYSYMTTGKYDSAAYVIRDFVAAYPDQERADELFLKNGELYYSIGDVEKALAVYDEFLKTYPNSDHRGAAYYWRGKALADFGALGEAEESFRLSFEEDPDGEFAVSSAVEIGAIRSQEGDYDAAVEIYDKAVIADEENERLPELLYLKALAYDNKGDVGSAYDQYEEVASFFGSTVFADKAKVRLGVIEMEAGRYDDAATRFMEVSRDREDDLGAEAQYYQGVALAKKGSHRAAITAFVRVFNAYPRYDEWNAKAYVGVGDGYKALGDVEQARAMYQEAIDRFGGDELYEETVNEAKEKLRKL